MLDKPLARSLFCGPIGDCHIDSALPSDVVGTE
jgi:hypothetical protein